VIVTWRRGTNDLHAQRFDADGNRLWGVAGIEIGSTTSGVARLVSDGSGGVVICWSDTRGGVYGQRFDTDGLPLWEPVQGLPITPDSVANDDFAILRVDGGVFVAWSDNRSATPENPDNNNIYLQMIDLNGDVLWTGGDLAVFTWDINHQSPILHPDGSGGVYVLYETPDHAAPGGRHPGRIQRVDGTGTMLWGKKYLAWDPFSRNYHVFDHDVEGIVVIWEEKAYNPYWDLRMNRLTPDGSKLWGVVGRQFLDPSTYTEPAAVIPDRPGGAFLVWADNVDNNLWGQRIDREAEVLWAPEGVQITSAEELQTRPQIIKSRLGGAMIVYTDFRDPYWGGDIWYEHLNYDGTVGYTSSVPEEMGTNRLQFELTSPVTSSTTLRYVLPQATDIRLKLYNVRGRLHWARVMGHRAEGPHQEPLHLNDLPSGLYWVSLEGEGVRATRRLLIAR
jgi:hypothetical protein